MPAIKTTTHVQRFDALSAMLTVLEQSKDSQGEWLRTQPHQGSLDSFDEIGTLDAALDRARTLGDIADEIHAIDALATALAAKLPPPQSLKRQRVNGRNGYAVRPHAVFRGDLAHAWKRTRRQARPAQQAITLMVPVCWHACIESTQIRWSTAASLALAMVAEQAGYQVEIWAAAGGPDLWADESANLSLMRLKTAGTPWNTQNVALAAHPTFLRRLLFRLWETLVPQHGELAGGYGRPHTPGEMRTALDTYGHIDPQSVLVMGANQTDDVDSLDSAAAWLEAAVDTLQGLA